MGVSKSDLIVTYLTLWLLSYFVNGDLLDDRGSCEVQRCFEHYSFVNDYYQADRNGISDRAARVCAALRTYKQCLNVLDACTSDLNFQGAKRASEEQFKTNNCSEEGPVYPAGPTPEFNNTVEERYCMFNGEERFSYCTLFGDPHLRTFGGVEKTCRLKGAWPLIDNKFLTVQVTNDYISHDNILATFTKRVTVIVKRVVNDGQSGTFCATKEALFYHAEAGSLPTTFADGQKTHGSYNSLVIKVIIPGEQVEINLSYVSIKVVIRQLDNQFLSVGVQIPDSVLNDTLTNPAPRLIQQLCIHGCPESETVDISQYLTESHNFTPTISESRAQTFCRRAGVADFYFDSCVFDVMMSGQESLTEMAAHAYQDTRLYATRQPVWNNRTNLEIYRKRSAVYQYTTQNTASGSCALASSLLTLLFVYIMHILLSTC